MEEYLEMVYQWHQGRSIRQIRDSLKISRKTIGKYLRALMELGLSRDRPLPPEEELAQMVAAVVQPAVFQQPAQEKIRPCHQQIQDWLDQRHMTIQQVQRLLEEEHQLGVSYMSLYRYVRSHIQPEPKPVTVRLHSRRPTGPGRLRLCRADRRRSGSTIASFAGFTRSWWNWESNPGLFT